MRNFTGRLGGGGMQRGRFLQPRDEPRRCARFPTRSLSFSDEYSVLGLTPFASKTDVKRAYKRLALKYHPDVIRNDTEREKHKAFTDIKSAYESLMDRFEEKEESEAMDGCYDEYDEWDEWMGFEGGMPVIYNPS
ncbi:chaperone protein dnaJ 8, chloroplastic isoform X2 [Cinnamomum micranthum f. kanehirae]|uniref:Chaperone protein dnaJ 8, chloroplastic isoform X2 n=1 Tax=Cinnamomum micranthum f. kanehirae TaxID=337451 RepID=A0A3S3NE06_9MAGN|nr:chaperone protein dnaJ 8, chloroplastic isoform X2 [Cinnamomum micranthum f. kanehirae]